MPVVSRANFEATSYCNVPIVNINKSINWLNHPFFFERGEEGVTDSCRDDMHFPYQFLNNLFNLYVLNNYI